MKNVETAGFSRWIGWLIVAFFAVLVGVYELQLLSFNPEAVSEEVRPNLLHHLVMFYTHTTFATFALLVGVWQFLPKTRRTSYHRWAGRFYVVCVAIASISGLLVAPTTEGGPVVAVGFMLLAVLWFAVTAKAYLLARAGDFVAHRVWMIRSYALTCAGISLRIIVPVGITSGTGFTNSYIAAAWGSWTINLLIAEWIVRRSRLRETVKPSTL